MREQLAKVPSGGGGLKCHLPADIKQADQRMSLRVDRLLRRWLSRSATLQRLTGY